MAATKKSLKRFRWRGLMNAGEVPCVLCQRESSGEPATLEIAASLARQCRSGDCILLNGDLGAGKTAFARGFIQAVWHLLCALRHGRWEKHEEEAMAGQAVDLG